MIIETIFTLVCSYCGGFINVTVESGKSVREIRKGPQEYHKIVLEPKGGTWEGFLVRGNGTRKITYHLECNKIFKDNRR